MNDNETECIEAALYNENKTYHYLTESIRRLKREQAAVLDEITEINKRNSDFHKEYSAVKTIRKKSERLVELQSAIAEMTKMQDSEMNVLNLKGSQRSDVLNRLIALRCPNHSTPFEVAVEVSTENADVTEFYTSEEITKRTETIYFNYESAKDTSLDVEKRNDSITAYNRAVCRLYEPEKLNKTHPNHDNFWEHREYFFKQLDDDGNEIEWHDLAHYIIKKEFDAILSMFDSEEDEPEEKACVEVSDIDEVITESSRD